ncbi:nucleoside recognition domain-containing protein [Vulcanibacillus modesticaldus]
MNNLNKIIELSNYYQKNSQTSNRDKIVSQIYSQSEIIAKQAIRNNKDKTTDLDKRLDDILTSKIFGYPIMLLILSIVFWMTIVGANYPSQILATIFFYLQEQLTNLFQYFNAPEWLRGFLVDGVYRGLAWVVSVMLPPMAIFFPLFTILEDLGYLPRVAFNLDRFFQKAGAHGKQSLTMSMGFGCNAAGIISCRIIESPRERLIAILTNNFVPCNGRFPTLITVATIFFGAAVSALYSTIIASMVIVGIVIVGIIVTLITSWLLSKTLLKGVPSSFTLELPPYRKPQIMKVFIRSVYDRTMFVLKRAVKIAAPAGAITWLLANTYLNGNSLIDIGANFLQPLGYAIGLDGYILMAFILGFPANEIVFPILIMSYLSQGSLMELDSFAALKTLLLDHGWTWLTALNLLLFSLLHFPCGTTMLTIKKETGSIKWTALAFIIPTSIAFLVTFAVAQTVRLLGIL